MLLPAAEIVSMNIRRRHLSEPQQSMIGGRAKGVYSDAAKERKAVGQKNGGKVKNCLVANLPPSTPAKARDQADAAVKVSGKSIDHATKPLGRFPS